MKGRNNIRCPRLTGIPPHIALMSQMVSLESNFTTVGDHIISEMHTELNKRNVGGEVFHANDILESIHQVHEQMKQDLNLLQIANGVPGGSTGASNAEAECGTAVSSPDGSHQLFFWGGCFHTVPENFVIPKMNMHTSIMCWWVGMKYPKQVPPLRFAKKKDFSYKVGSTLSQMRMLMDLVYHCGKQHGFDFGLNNRHVKDPAGATALYNLVEPYYRFERLTLDRFAQLSWKTIFCQWSQHYQSRYIGQIGEVNRRSVG